MLNIRQLGDRCVRNGRHLVIASISFRTCLLTVRSQPVDLSTGSIVVRPAMRIAVVSLAVPAHTSRNHIMKLVPKKQIPLIDLLRSSRRSRFGSSESSFLLLVFASKASRRRRGSRSWSLPLGARRGEGFGTERFPSYVDLLLLDP